MFKLINYKEKLTVIEETNTQLTFRCPVCNGKLKLNLNNNGYSCFTNYCTTKDIRKKLGYVPPLDSNTYENINSLVIDEVKFDRPIKPIIVADYKRAETRVLSDRRLTKYIYNENSLVERVDYLKQQRPKECFPKYRTGNSWKYGSNNSFGFFNQQYISSSGTLIIVEGEKCADIFSYSTNLLAVTPPAFGWNKSYILKFLILFLPFINNVIYIPDNDKAGYHKAEIIQTTSWSAGIACKIIDLRNHFDIDEGEDIADLIEKDVDIIQTLGEIYV